MAFYYKGGGLVADSALLLNTLFLVTTLTLLQATLTLPGIAGSLLSLGMAVDANVLILERVREEIRNGKSVRMALDLGYNRAFSTIVDAHMTTIIASGFLYQFGTGPIKGFAVTLFWGDVISLITAIFVTRTYYDWRVQDKNFTV